MSGNPYESPSGSTVSPNRAVVIALRVVAALLWMLAPIPAIAIVVPMLVFETPESRRNLPVIIYVMAVLQFLLPTIGLALLGAACWYRSRWLTLIGLYAFIPLVVMLAVAMLRS